MNDFSNTIWPSLLAGAVAFGAAVAVGAILNGQNEVLNSDNFKFMLLATNLTNPDPTYPPSHPTSTDISPTNTANICHGTCEQAQFFSRTTGHPKRNDKKKKC